MISIGLAGRGGDTMELEGRIKRLEDIEKIKQLKALYCEISDLP